ncbi:MAG: HepT-like ribonuclease domain-containing protein [Candidatus Omnitrophota bacterium]
MPEFNYARGRIAESLQFITSEIKEFEQDYLDKALQDYQQDKKLQKLMDRTLENILTALIEISGTVLAREGISVENYALALKECAKKFGLSGSEQDSLGKLAVQRNRLAHRYLNFRWQAIMMFIETKPLVLKLISRIAEKRELAD